MTDPRDPLLDDAYRESARDEPPRSLLDRFLPGHNLAALEELATVLEGIERRHAA